MCTSGDSRWHVNFFRWTKQVFTIFIATTFCMFLFLNGTSPNFALRCLLQPSLIFSRSSLAKRHGAQCDDASTSSQLRKYSRNSSLSQALDCDRIRKESTSQWHQMTTVAFVLKLSPDSCTARGMSLESGCMAIMLNRRRCYVTNHPSFAIVGLGKCGTSFL